MLENMKEIFAICGYGFLIILMFYIVVCAGFEIIKDIRINSMAKRLYEKLSKETKEK